MQKDVSNLKLTEELITGINNVGPAKASAVIAVAPTIGKLLDFSPQELAGKVRGLSTSVATAIVQWAEGECARFSSDLAQDSGLKEEQVLPGERDLGVESEADGPMFGDLAILDTERPKVTSKRVRQEVQTAVEVIHSRYDKTLVVRRG